MRFGIICNGYSRNQILQNSIKLENDIRALHQKNMSIQEFYSAMTDLWDQLALTESAELKACGAYIKRRE
jgi:hypothetical protein